MRGCATSIERFPQWHSNYAKRVMTVPSSRREKSPILRTNIRKKSRKKIPETINVSQEEEPQIEKMFSPVSRNKRGEWLTTTGRSKNGSVLLCHQSDKAVLGPVANRGAINLAERRDEW